MLIVEVSLIGSPRETKTFFFLNHSCIFVIEQTKFISTSLMSQNIIKCHLSMSISTQHPPLVHFPQLLGLCICIYPYVPINIRINKMKRNSKPLSPQWSALLILNMSMSMSMRTPPPPLLQILLLPTSTTLPPKEPPSMQRRR